MSDRRGIDERRHLICRALIDERRIVNRTLDRLGQADPDWDMLLYLYDMKKKGEMSYVWAMCSASNVPNSTAHRHSTAMISRGDVLRMDDHEDHRRVGVVLSDAMEQRLDALMDRLHEERLKVR